MCDHCKKQVDDKNTILMDVEFKKPNKMLHFFKKKKNKAKCI